MKTFAETLPFQRTPHPSVPCTPKVFHTQNFDTWKVTFAFHPSNDEENSLCAFSHGDDGIVRFELIRDGGTAIDAFFNYWPMIFQKQRSVMCHHHDAAIFNKRSTRRSPRAQRRQSRGCEVLEKGSCEGQRGVCKPTYMCSPSTHRSLHPNSRPVICHLFILETEAWVGCTSLPRFVQPPPVS